MRQVLAIARLRFREGVAAKLLLLAPLAFLCGIGFALWAPGGDDAARAAVADRAGLGVVSGAALLVALVAPCLGFPGDLRKKRALTLAASPVSRFALVLGGSLGYGVLATAVLLAATAGVLIGIEAGGLGASARAPTYPYVAVGDETQQLEAGEPGGFFTFSIPDGYAAGDELPLRLRPVGRYQEGEDFQVSALVIVDIAPRGADFAASVFAEFHPSDEAFLRVPLGDLAGGDEALLRIRRGPGWKLRFDPGTVEVGELPEPFAWSALKGMLCLVPLLFVAAAAANCGAVRFNAPTAAGLALGLLAVFAGQDVLVEASQTVERMQAAAHGPDDGHDHGHDHGPTGEVSWVQSAAAGCVGALVRALPSNAPYDRSRDLVERAAVPASAPVIAAVGALPSFLVLTAAGWLLLRRRELIPR